MANYPSGIGISVNTAAILELVDEVGINTFLNSKVSYGYVRQLGLSFYAAALDDRVQYLTTGSEPFQQDGVTYAFVDESNILFVQDDITPP